MNSIAIEIGLTYDTIDLVLEEDRKQILEKVEV